MLTTLLYASVTFAPSVTRPVLASTYSSPLMARRVVAPLACAEQSHSVPVSPLKHLKALPPSAWSGLLAGAAIFLAPGSAHAASVASVADSSFVQATSLIFVSELGDKTFFIAALLAARASKLLTFAGCAGALAFMTVLSVAIGQIFHAVPDSFTNGLPLDDYVAIASFLYFGVKSIVDALGIEEDGEGIAEEREDAEKTLNESGINEKGGWPLVVEASTLTLAAEIGDRSQLATIALGASGNPFGVVRCALRICIHASSHAFRAPLSNHVFPMNLVTQALGGTVGHCMATGMAVLGGSFISKYFSERVIGLLGGVLFIVFALTTAVGLF